MAFRVPTPTVSVGRPHRPQPVKDTSYEEINAAMKKASETYLKGILGVHRRRGRLQRLHPRQALSSIFDAGSGDRAERERFFKLVSWYDNEWGYSNRVVDLTEEDRRQL
jgi:glyceraldehyde 3-phosphate dehydrogenase